MGKAGQKSAKYMIEAEVKSSSRIEKKDIIGAIHGQTEGLLMDGMELKDLRNRGKVGRIEVDLEKTGEGTLAELKIPSSIDKAKTAILAASLETVERIGPGNATIKVNQITDVRDSKREYIIKRSKQLLERLDSQKTVGTEELNQIKKEVREENIETYKGFDAGEEAEESRELIIVEGKSDLKTLAQYGLKNTVSVGGTSIPKGIQEIVDKKEQTTLFADGDRGGKLIKQELTSKADIDYFAKAPSGKEVEELNEKQAYEALRDKKPITQQETQSEEKVEEADEEHKKYFESLLKDLTATRAIYTANQDFEVTSKAPKEKFENVDENPYIVGVDGEITQEMLNHFEEKGVKYMVGRSLEDTASSSKITIQTKDQVTS